MQCISINSLHIIISLICVLSYASHFMHCFYTHFMNLLCIMHLPYNLLCSFCSTHFSLHLVCIILFYAPNFMCQVPCILFCAPDYHWPIMIGWQWQITNVSHSLVQLCKASPNEVLSLLGCNEINEMLLCILPPFVNKFIRNIGNFYYFWYKYRLTRWVYIKIINIECNAKYKMHRI